MKRTHAKNANKALNASKALLGTVILAVLLSACTRIPSPEELQAAQTAYTTQTAEAAQTASAAMAQGETKMTGTTDTGDVAISLTPRGFAGNALAFDIRADTHSVDLSLYELAKITTLAADGRAYKPANAPALNGHHAGGTLSFNIKKEPQRFSITIRGIPAQQERTYQWGE